MHLNVNTEKETRNCKARRCVDHDPGGQDHVGMRLRRYSITASVPLATMAALGVRKRFPSRLRHLRDNTGFNLSSVRAFHILISQLLTF